MRMRPTYLAAYLATACCLGPLTAWAQKVVVTQSGPVQGIGVSGVNEWLGIPYAAPPVGPLRFYPPQPPAAFSGTFQATQFGSSCPQSGNSFGHSSTDEDCLTLNVYAPASATPSSHLPVMVWIHGGAFENGEGYDYDPSAMINQSGVIVVTINYRLGLLGFLAHAALAAGDPRGSTGNYGIQDQQAAIAWVRANIAGFGGNPGRMTIFGESAGGQSVEIQLTAPQTAPLFGAIIQSGAYAQALPTRAAAEATGATLATTMLGCPSGSSASVAACLRAVPVAALVAATPSTNLSVSPNVDGTTIPREPLHAYASGAFQHVRLINGSNHDEYRLFVAIDDFLTGVETPATYMAAVDAQFGSLAPAVLAQYPLSAYPSPDYALAALVTDYSFACGAHLLNSLAAQHTTVYSYELSDPNAPDLFLPPDPNFPVLGDSHAADLPYLFPQLVGFFGKPAAFTQSQLYLASTMRAFWTSLATYGRPLAPRSGVWQPYNSAGTLLSLIPPAPAQESNFVTAHNCAFWKPVLLMQAGLPPTTPY